MAVELVHSTRRRARLRARIIVSFALGGLLLSAVLAVTTYGLARQTLVSARERTSLDQAIANAVIVQARLDTDDPVTVTGPTGLDESGDEEASTADPLVAEVLNSLASPSGGTQLLNSDGSWQASGSETVPAELPAALLERVIDDNTPTRMRYDNGNETVFAIGIPLPDSNRAYFEVIPLDELQSSLALLGLSLVGGGVVTTLLGGGFGVWAARRVLSPLGEISAAAGAIAGGQLDTRLADVEDPDLEALVTSFNGMATALQDRIDRDARFASDVSHELRSPLMTLRASIDVMQSRREEMSDRGQHALDLLADDVDRFERLIGDLLEISKIDAGAVAIRRDLVDPGAMLTAAVAAVGRANLPVVIHPDVEGLLVEVDKRRIGQVLANLLDNADFYAGGATRVVVVREGDEVRFVVEDAGPGIPEDERGRVFERFARGTTAGQRGAGGGTGLGLALVSEHVRLHGGRVWVEPRSGGVPGSRFVVALPVVTA